MMTKFEENAQPWPRYLCCSCPLLAKRQLQRASENAQGAGKAEQVERARLWVGAAAVAAEKGGRRVVRSA